jgi:hypothetical protein
MAHLIFRPTSKHLENHLEIRHALIVKVLKENLPSLGVKENDIVVVIMKSDNVLAANEEHIEIILKTDNPRVTAQYIVSTLEFMFRSQPFEVTRYGVGSGVTEFMYEVIAAYFSGNRRNWASNYSTVRKEVKDG